MMDEGSEMTRRAIYQQMAESIQLAHNINPNSWSVQFYDGRIIVFVSEYTIWLFQREGSGRLELLLKSPAPESDLITRVKDDFRRTESLGLDLVRVGVPYLQFEQAWLEIAGNHREVVEILARSVRSRTSRAASFDPAALAEISEQSGQTLPTPNYANDVTARVTLGKAMPVYLAERFAHSIRLAHGINDRSWSVYQRRGSDQVLSLGFSNYLIWTPRLRRVWIVVIFGQVDDALRERWSENLDPDRLFDGEGGWYWAEGSECEELVRDMSAAHDAAIARAAHEVRNRAHRATSFDDTLLVEISEVIGEELPRPGYVRELGLITPPQHLHSGENSAGPLKPLALVADRATVLGLTYSESRLATFYTALQTKGFVILSGISGTGKSKLAQAFVGCLPDTAPRQVDRATTSFDQIELTIKPYMLKHDRAYLPVTAIRGLGIPDQKETRKVRIEFDGTQAIGSLRRFEDRSPGSPLVLLTFTRVFAAKVADIGLGGSLYLEPELNDDADIVGFRISTHRDAPSSPSDAFSPVSVPNHLFLSVRPDWRDSRALLGYHNPLLGAYEWTAFLRFILRAAENFRGPEDDRIAWFVILDEMNLAHVEYYFADLLSVLESGRDADGWTREAIRIERPEPTEDQDASEVPPAMIHLPPNLYIVGTVNMDETTHAFSPKVLDRAFTIELSEVDFSDYPPTALPEMAETVVEAEQQSFLEAFSRDGRFVGIDKAGIADILVKHPEYRAWLQVLNDLLARSRMQFGYRVFDEIVAFAGAYCDLMPEGSVAQAFDLAVLMKVLPKFSGSTARLERPLLDVLAWCVDPLEPPVAKIRAMADSISDLDWVERGFDSITFPTTSMRVRRMLDTLATEGFVSFG